MEFMLSEQAGTFSVPFKSLMPEDSHNDLMLIERLRFVDLPEVVDGLVSGGDLQFETARYDDDNLYLDVHTSYPVILRFSFRDPGLREVWEWYAVHHRGGGLVVFEKIDRFKASVERSGFEEPLLWG